MSEKFGAVVLNGSMSNIHSIFMLVIWHAFDENIFLFWSTDNNDEKQLKDDSIDTVMEV